MQIIELDTSSFAEHKKIEILVPSSDKSGFRHYCVAIILSETPDGLLLLYPISRVPKRGQTFYVQRQGFQHPVAINLSPQSNRVRFQGNVVLFTKPHPNKR